MYIDSYFTTHHHITIFTLSITICVELNPITKKTLFDIVCLIARPVRTVVLYSHSFVSSKLQKRNKNKKKDYFHFLLYFEHIIVEGCACDMFFFSSYSNFTL